MIEKIKTWINKMIPRIHNLPQIIYINWMDYEWFIRK